MYCICCGQEIIQKLKIKNLFKREQDIICEYCYNLLDVVLELSILPVVNRVAYAIRISSKSNYSNHIFYTREISSLYYAANKLFDDYIIVQFETEKNLLNSYYLIDKFAEITGNILVIYH